MSQLYHQTITILEARQFAGAGGFYAILDACDTPSVPENAKELGPDRAVSLYKGHAEENLEGIAPYLVSADPALFDWIAETLWSEPWGIFARSEADLETLRKHFRRFLLVESPEGEEWYFRYYDPRVLDTYLPTCTDAELKDFFGPVTMFAITDPESYGVKVHSRTPMRESEPKIRIAFKRPA